ncbi:hypothetical protein CYMTET_12892 [Cymbomonas tetramitiformis]|uniref:Uncharacterized protein n=1 Tax=Cymbomonas tetramitiformis TaxID=36881 RepID=A0AAE0LBK9_9CHLO|nr:hypothetical protein CYMTET_12892 [Cymbomonas tetramitiformis]
MNADKWVARVSQNTFIDKIWLAVYIVMMNVPLKLFFVTLFTVGGSVKTPDHWNAGMRRQVEKVVGSSYVRWVEHLMFLVYAMLFDHMHLSRALARIFSGLLLLLDSTFLGMRIVLSKALKRLKHLRQSLWFIIQVKVRQRAPWIVFEEFELMLKAEEEAKKLDDDAQIFEQVRHEMDSGFTQFAVTLLISCWMVIIYILIVYATLIRELMGSSAEHKILQTWIMTLLLDNLGLQLVKSMTIKIWVQQLMQRFQESQLSEANLGQWYEGYLTRTLPTTYTYLDDGVEYDNTGMGL